MHLISTAAPHGPGPYDLPTTWEEPEAEFADALDSLAPTIRVAPIRTEAPPSPRRRWRPRPRLSEAVAGMAVFLLMVVAVTVPAAAYVGQSANLVLALGLAVAMPPLAAQLAMARTSGAATRRTVASLGGLLAALAGTFAVGTSIGAIAWMVATAPAEPMLVLEPALVASAYSLVTAMSAAWVRWHVTTP